MQFKLETLRLLSRHRKGWFWCFWCNVEETDKSRIVEWTQILFNAMVFKVSGTCNNEYFLSNFEFIRVEHIIAFKLCFHFKCLSLIFSSLFTDGDQTIDLCVALFALVHPKSFVHKRTNVIYLPYLELTWFKSKSVNSFFWG